jgi:hypothetical protein
VVFASKVRLQSTRILIVIVGACAIGWSIFTIRIYRLEAAFAAPALRILAEDRFSPEQLNALAHQIDVAPVASLRPTALSNVATIQLRLAEVALQSGNAQLAAAAFDKLQSTVGAVLERAPSSSFMWLTNYWVHSVRSGNPANALKSLGMSYAEGPNEGWIAVRRNPVALRAFSSLPDQLADEALNEFARLVSSGYYPEAANNLAHSGWSVHDKLLARLAPLDEGDRRRFAKALEAYDLEGVVVPGIEDSRPF